MKVLKHDKEPYTLNPAELFINTRMREYPTLYRNEMQVMLSSVFGTSGSTIWKKGLIVTTDKCYKGMKDGKPVFGRYPLRISAQVAWNLRDYNADWFHCGGTQKGPIYKVPEDVHPSWVEMIGYTIYILNKITPEMYEALTKARTAIQGFATHNQGYISDYKQVYESLPSISARLEFIRRKKELGKIPPDFYQGQNI